MQFSNIESSAICPIFSPCSNYFVTISNNNIYVKASCLDLKNHSQILIKQSKSGDGKGQYPTVKFSPNSKLLALQFKKRIQIYDINGSLKIKIRDGQNQIEGMIWLKDSIQLMVFFSNQICCTIFHLLNQTQFLIKNPKFPSQNGISFSKSSHSGVFMAMLQKNNLKDCIGIYFASTGELINYITLDTFDASKIQFTQNGYLMVTEHKINFKVLIVDIYYGVISTYGNKDFVLGICCTKFSNTSKFVALGAHDDCVHLLNTQTWKLIAEFQLNGQIDCKKGTILKEQDQGIFTPINAKSFKIAKSPDNKKQLQNGNTPGISILQFSPNDCLLAVKIGNQMLI